MSNTRKVAELAGVSIGTVSRVLNNQPGVSDPTRQRVLAVAQELNYVAPKRLPVEISRVTHLGLLIRPTVPDPVANPFYADVYHGVEQGCRESHINLSFSSLNMAGDQLRSLPALIADERISGIVVVGAVPQCIIEGLLQAVQTRHNRTDFPMVLVDNWLPRCPWDAVVIDNAGGIVLAVEMLVQQGHRHITLIGGPIHSSIVERTAAYEKTMLGYGLKPAIVRRNGLDPQDGESAVDDLLRDQPQTTAIVCSNDSQAIGLLRRLKELGYVVPNDFSLIGFDDIQMAELTLPRLTTIRVDRLGLGRVAVEMLLNRVRMPECAPIKSIVGVSLVERDSVSQPHTKHAERKEVVSADPLGFVGTFQ
jgi:DNA-binding LacI/PurR family transcriptional regulator